MKVQDAARWLVQKAELGEKIGQKDAVAFVAFVEDWCEGAEYAMGYLGTVLRPIDALRAALAPTEARHGFLTTNMLANMLLVICANWEYGDTVFESMTEFEQRIVVEVAGLITAEMQASAEGVTVPHESAHLAYGQQVPTDG